MLGHIHPEEASDMDRLKVIYILGAGRSGSTLLSMLLGNQPGLFNAGEIRYLLYENMRARDLPCSCGLRVEDCPFWGDVASNLQGSLINTVTETLRSRNAIRLFTKTGKNTIRTLSNELQEVYDVIASKAGTHVIIDTSKHPLYAYCLKHAPGIELYIVHLVRDPRGMVSSWSRRKGYLETKPALRVAMTWNLLNGLGEMLFRNYPLYIRLRYEDFGREPLESLNEIVKFCGLNIDLQNVLHGDGYFHLTKVQHILAGNPEKYSVGSVIRIRERAWNLPGLVSISTKLLTYILGKRYGYW